MSYEDLVKEKRGQDGGYLTLWGVTADGPPGALT